MDNEVLGATVRKLREGLGLKAIVLAYQVPISRAYLCEIEKGRRIPSIAMFNDIARGLKMKPSDFWRAVADEIDANA